jgi:hypothetical protein
LWYAQSMMLLPVFDIGDSPLGDLREACRSIAHEYRVSCASKRSAARKASAPANRTLQRSVYELVLRALRWSQEDDLLDLAIENGWDASKEDDIFWQAFGAIFPPGQGRPPRSTINRLGKQLTYAYRHYVPPIVLEGFLLQCRAKDIGERALSASLEPGWENWVSQHLGLAMHNGLHDAGRYEEAIVARAENFAEALAHEEKPTANFQGDDEDWPS